MIPSRFAGMVDPQICKILLTELGLSDSEVDKFLPKVLTHMGEVYGKMQKKVILNNGVRQLLAILATSTDCVTEALTGDLTTVAGEKLTLGGIRAYFSELFCADNYFDRRSLVEDMVLTCMKKYELNARRDVVIVGDTPLDMQAANASDVTSVGATCGIYTTAQLTNAGARCAFPTLEPTRELLAALGVMDNT